MYMEYYHQYCTLQAHASPTAQTCSHCGIVVKNQTCLNMHKNKDHSKATGGRIQSDQSVDQYSDQSVKEQSDQ